GRTVVGPPGQQRRRPHVHNLRRQLPGRCRRRGGLAKTIKDRKLRVSGKKRDDLQEVLAAVKGFNFRD
ncbi:MAG: DUF520 family protein, partial [Actinomycetota bacterium]|nr:DUF520 family protein [Actinomycetota bacterium]